MHKERTWLVPGIVLLLLTVVVMFWQPLFSGDCLFPPADGSPFYSNAHQQQALASFYGPAKKPFYPTKILAIALPPLVYHTAGYIVDVVLVGLGAAYLLWGLGVRGLAVVLASIGLAFSGYNFTLISAGHRGVFDMLPYAVFLFGFLDRAITRRSLFHFAMAGACMAWGLMPQPDIMVLFILLAAAYCLFRLIGEWRVGSEQRRTLVLKTIGGGAVALLVFLGLSVGTFSYIARKVLPERDKLIERVSEAGDETEESKPKQTWRERYDFATSWSMPPEEILEFIAPSVYGIETGDRRGPYWGRLGRTKDWWEHRQGLMNLKQHSLYLGVLQLLFAAYAVVVVAMNRNTSARRRLSRGTGILPVSDTGKMPVPHSGGDAMLGPAHTNGFTNRSETFFWAIAFLVCLLLALGRYFPLYRLFFSIPYLSKIRAPVKFVHLCELALCVLFAFGLQAFLGDLAAEREKAGSRRRRFTVFGAVSLAIGVLLLVAIPVVSMSAPALRAHWAQLGLGDFADVILPTMTGALRHGGVLFLVGAAIFAAARFGAAWRAVPVALTGGLLLTVPLDLVLVGSPYVRVRDVSPWYGPNPIAERIERERQHGRTSYHLSQRTWRHWLYGSFARHDVSMLEPRQDRRPPEAKAAYFRTLAANSQRLWELTATRHLVGSVQALQKLLTNPAFEAVEHFNVERGRVVPAPPGTAQGVLAQFNGALPMATVVHGWEYVNQDEALRRLADPEWQPRNSVLIEGQGKPRSSGQANADAQIIRHTDTRIEVEVDAAEEGVMLFNRWHSPDGEVRVDGKRAKLLRCNYIMQGVQVPAGKHRVVFSYRPYTLFFALNLAVSLVLLAWLAYRGCPLRRGRKATAQP